MEMPKYDGIIDQWKVDLIIHRAKLLGFRQHEIPDALQEIVLVVIKFEYDPNKPTAPPKAQHQPRSSITLYER